MQIMTLQRAYMQLSMSPRRRKYGMQGVQTLARINGTVKAGSMLCSLMALVVPLLTARAPSHKHWMSLCLSYDRQQR